MNAIVLAFLLLLSADELQLGQTFELDGKKAVVTRLDHAPVAQNQYTLRFKFDSAENPKLHELRSRYHLDDVVEPGKDEFDRQVHLMDWVHHRFKKFGQPSTSARGALQILDGIDRGETFFCAQYAQLMVSASASLGWVDRVLALRRHQDSPRGGSTEHSTTEIWSNQYGKWIMLDPTSNLYLEKDGVPLNAFEIRQEWFYQNGTNLTFVIGKERRRLKKSDLPIFLKHFPGFGDLKIDPEELDKYGFIGYIPNTDLMNSSYDYGQMFIVKDQLCDGTPWHKRDNPAFPATEPYFSLGASEVSLTLAGGKLSVNLSTLTPNLKEFQVRSNSGEWTGRPPAHGWNAQPGTNVWSVRTVNNFGVSGPESMVEIVVAKP